MKHRLTFLLSLLLTAVVAMAAQVSREEAQSTAEQFMAARYASARGGVFHSRVRMVVAERAYYVFNVGESEGFVIVSRDDRAPAILGYSDEGFYNPLGSPDNMEAFLQGYADEIGQLPATANARAAAPKRVVRNSISPLLTTLWKQGSPYNDQCPTVGGQRAVTGCVATALAQVMNYHQYPIAATKAVGSLASTTFDWNKMHDSYKAGDDASEVAKLMHYCGVAVQMNYGADASSAASEKTVTALIDYFDYDAGAKYVKRSGFGYTDWVALLYNELASQRPVLMGGQSTGGGHAFVCDGYDEEDFFHINWGWGGLSNGYFRLSNLAPDNQGTGGSTTSDGYNLDLGAAIGVQPNKGTVLGTVCLTTTEVKWGEGSQYYAWTKMSNGNFQIFPIFSFTNDTGRDSSFRYGMRLLKDDATVADFLLQDKFTTIPNGTTKITGSTIQFGNGLADGTYRLIGIYQASGGDWTACEDADKRYIECVISGSDLTAEIKNLGGEKPVLSVTGITGTDGLSYYMPQDVTVTLANSGDGDFNGDITLELISGYTVYQKLGGAVADIPAGESRSITVTISPVRTGSFELAVVQGFFLDGDVLGTKPVSISAPSGNVNIAMSDYKNNNTGKIIYGNTFKASITAANSGSDYKYGFTAKLYKSTGGGSGTLAYEKTDNTVLPAGATQTYDFEFPDLEYGEEYFCYVGYYTFSGNTRTYHNTGGFAYTMAHGFVTIDADGTVTAEAPAASVTIPGNAIAVDLRGQDVVATVTPNDNPNCLYLLDEGAAVPAGIEGMNIVKGSTAETIVLTDGKDFVAPEPFTAATVSYSRTFATGSDGHGGWTTLVVPFDVDKVTVDGVEKQWLQSATDTGKHFWVKKLVSDDTGSVTFEDTEKIEANTPYLIAVPDNTWGDEWDLSGKTLVFTGYDKTVSTEKAVVSGDCYRFSGTTRSLVLTAAYAVNAGGTAFERGDVTVDPFRACFTPYSATNAVDVLQINLTASIPTAVSTLPAERRDDAVYTLDGRRVSVADMMKGVFIKNGKKFVR